MIAYLTWTNLPIPQDVSHVEINGKCFEVRRDDGVTRLVVQSECDTEGTVVQADSSDEA